MFHVLVIAALYFAGYGLIHILFPILAKITASYRFGPGSQYYDWRNDTSNPELRKHYQMWSLNEDQIAYFVGFLAALAYFLSSLEG